MNIRNIQNTPKAAASTPNQRVSSSPAASSEMSIASDTLVKSAAPPQPIKMAAKQMKPGRILGTAGVGIAGLAGGTVATSVIDILFHWGNNGGTSFASPIYWGVAALAAVGAMVLYNRK